MTLRSVLVSTDGPFTLSLLAFTVTLSLGRPHGSCGHPQGWNTRFRVKSSSTHPLKRKQREREEEGDSWCWEKRWKKIDWGGEVTGSGIGAGEHYNYVLLLVFFIWSRVSLYTLWMKRVESCIALISPFSRGRPGVVPTLDCGVSLQTWDPTVASKESMLINSDCRS